MNRTDAVFVAVTVALSAFAVAYFLDPPAPRYYPAEGVWRMGKRADAPSMGWYGRSAWGLGMGCLVGLVTYRLVYRTPNPHGTVPPISERYVRLLSLLALGALVLLAASIVIAEYERLTSETPAVLPRITALAQQAGRAARPGCATHMTPQRAHAIVSAVAARESVAAPVPARPVRDAVPESGWAPVAVPAPGAPEAARASECCSGTKTVHFHQLPGKNVPA